MKYNIQTNNFIFWRKFELKLNAVQYDNESLYFTFSLLNIPRWTELVLSLQRILRSKS